MRPTPILILLLLAAGCVSGGITPDKKVAAGVKRVRVIAMEAPPLQGLPARFRSPPDGNALADVGTNAQVAGSVATAQVAGSVATAAGATPLQGARVTSALSVVFLAPLLGELAVNSYCDQPQPSPSETIAVPEGIWIPTAVVAIEAQAQLSAAHIDATIEPGLKPISCVLDRRSTYLMENWMGPIRTWYNNTDPDLHYISAQSANSSYVLEVGISNYELFHSELLIQVMMRLFDPLSGKVIGRARAANAWHLPRIASYDEAFSGDAAPFKAIVAAEARTLVRDCLSQLNLVPGS